MPPATPPHVKMDRDHATVNRRYRLVRLVGQGGMGKVYEAEALESGERVAVKLLAPELLSSQEAVARLRREATIATTLRHPNILAIHEFEIDADGTPYLAMELLTGESLAQRLQRDGPLSLAAVLHIVGQAAAALEAAHRRGIIHRDLKPSNVFLCATPEQQVKVIDFGISKVLGSLSIQTRAGAMLGTPLYMAPEQLVERSESVDPRTDVYALGLIIYEMLAGVPPIGGSSLLAVMRQIAHKVPPSLLSIRPTVPPAVDELVLRALAKAKDERPASMRSLAAELEQAAGG